MKKPALFLLSILMLAGCTTVTKYESKSAAGPSKPEDYPIYIYAQKVKVPRASEIIGAMRVGDTPFTVFGGSLEGELEELRQAARRKGADAVQILSVEPPGFLHAKYRVNANLIRFTDTWESVPLTEKELLAGLRTHEKTRDPIEGIWSGNDVMRSRIGIIRNNAKPGRDFVAFILNSMNPTWQPGDKKMDLSKGEWPWVYRGNHYRDDCQSDGIAVTLQSPRTNAFVVQLSEQAPIIFRKETPAAN